MPLKRKEEEGNWYPTSVQRLDALLSNCMFGAGYGHIYAVRRNIAYNLQYIQYLEQTIADLKLSSVLLSQTWKSQIVVGCAVIECLLHYLIVVSGNQSVIEWDVTQEFTGAHKRVNERTLRIDSVVRERLETPRPVAMTFDAMLKKAESKRLLGNDQALYGKLKKLRPLRNRVHLQEIAQPADHDFNAFTEEEKKLMMQVLHAVFTGAIFTPSDDQRAYFSYLNRYVQTAD